MSHYARKHGRSQFFRFRALAGTFVQLGRVFARLVLIPGLLGPARGEAAARRPTWRHAGLVFVVVAALSLLAYGRTLTLPFIADDYVQIELGRTFGPVADWPKLAADALYRCRATSILLTYWFEQAAGIEPLNYKLLGLWVHILNSMLVFALGAWKPIGWHVSAVAAFLFAVNQRHSEAVIWFAALPELLVFSSWWPDSGSGRDGSDRSGRRRGCTRARSRLTPRRCFRRSRPSCWRRCARSPCFSSLGNGGGASGPRLRCS